MAEGQDAAFSSRRVVSSHGGCRFSQSPKRGTACRWRLRRQALVCPTPHKICFLPLQYELLRFARGTSLLWGLMCPRFHFVFEYRFARPRPRLPKPYLWLGVHARESTPPLFFCQGKLMWLRCFCVFVCVSLAGSCDHDNLSARAVGAPPVGRKRAVPGERKKCVCSC